MIFPDQSPEAKNAGQKLKKNEKNAVFSPKFRRHNSLISIDHILIKFYSKFYKSFMKFLDSKQ